MKKTFLTFGLLLVFLAPSIAIAGGLVPCDEASCTIDDFFTMLGAIHQKILTFAVPLATLVLTIGGILILVSAGNPKLATTGKTMLWSGIIGLVLTLGSAMIIGTVLSAMQNSTPT